MRLLTLLVLGLACAMVAPRVASAQSIDPNARSVELRDDCGLLDDCFETTSALTDWLWVDAGSGGRASEPTSLDPVSVNVGPGDFDFILCEDPGAGTRGWVSFTGSGRDVSRFSGTEQTFTAQGTTLCRAGVNSIGCTELSFRDLTVQGPGTGAVFVAEGRSSWDGVDIVADDTGSGPFSCASLFAWYDDDVDGQHFFWNVRFEAKRVANTADFTDQVFSGHGESWVYGSDFLFDIASGTGDITTISVRSPSGIRVFGSTVRARVSGTGFFFGQLIGIEVHVGQYHMHGGIINMDASQGHIGDVTSLLGAANTLVHTPGTAFVLKTGLSPAIPPGTTVTATRISAAAGADVQSPYLWPPSDTPPNMLSTTGSDLFVKTDEGPGQNEARLLVYDSGCSPDPWRRVSDDTCL